MSLREDVCLLKLPALIYILDLPISLLTTLRILIGKGVREEGAYGVICVEEADIFRVCGRGIIVG